MLELKNNSFQSRKSLNESLKNNVEIFSFEEIFYDDSKNYLKIKNSDINLTGKYPVIDQGEKFLAGYTNQKPKKIEKEDCIVFGDHSKVFKFINFPFVKGADGTKVLKLKNENFNTKYFYYFFKTICLPDLGYTRYYKILKEANIPVLKIHQQNELVKLLERIEKLLNIRKEQIHAYYDLIESLFFHILNNGNIEKNKLKDFIVTSQNGFSKRGKDSRGKIVLKIPNVNYNYLNFENINRIKLDNKDFKKYLLNLGDLLLVRVNGNPNYVGRSTVFDYTLENCCFNDHIIRIKTKDINVRYLSYYINSIYGKNQLLQNIKTSAGQYTISRNGLDNIEILYPKREMQNYFERVFNRVEEEKKKLNSSLAKLEILFNALMQEAFSGNLFKDWEGR